ncbi:MAG: Gfo/Idh/MocA family oxidoreductase [Desulfobacterales bacterium]|nr:Gfo/Idh/MocA family oxidoreductase [Desulfobacterales bacterium]
MKTAIIGAGRRRNGIGQYIGKYFQKNGAEIVSVLGTTQATAQEAASALKSYGAGAVAYSDFSVMIKEKSPDAVVIASPARTHYEYLLKCVEQGVHVFCEKPFVRTDKNCGDPVSLLDPLFEKAGRNHLKIAMNCQWPFSLPFYEELCGPVGPESVETFFIRMSPMASGREMISDSIPHALSILYRVFGPGDIYHLFYRADEEKNEEMEIKFNYASASGLCRSHVKLVRTDCQPREFSYGFNGRIVERVLDVDTYDIFFRYSGKTMQISDPLELSVRDFISAVEENREPQVGGDHIINNAILLKKINDGFETVKDIEE